MLRGASSLSTLLLEELYEVESIYRSIDTGLASIRGAPELKGLIDAIRAEVGKSIDALEWIRREVIRGLRSFSQKSRIYKTFYTQVLRDLHSARYRAIILS